MVEAKDWPGHSEVGLAERVIVSRFKRSTSHTRTAGSQSPWPSGGRSGWAGRSSYRVDLDQTRCRIPSCPHESYSLFDLNLEASAFVVKAAEVYKPHCLLTPLSGFPDDERWSPGCKVIPTAVLGTRYRCWDRFREISFAS